MDRCQPPVRRSADGRSTDWEIRELARRLAMGPSPAPERVSEAALPVRRPWHCRSSLDGMRDTVARFALTGAVLIVTVAVLGPP